VCKRTTTDPLVRMFLDRYGLNLLSIPREKAAVGDLYVVDGDRASAPGNVEYFLEPEVKLPPQTKNEHMADVEGEISDAVSLSAGIGLLEGFLAALGAPGVISKVKAGYTAKRAESLRFHLDDATRDSVDVMRLGGALAGRRPIEGHPMWSEGSRYYLVTAVARAPSITVIAKDDRSHTVDVGLEAMKVATADTAVSVEGSADVGITYTGPRKVAFGVELLELSFDDETRAVKLSVPEEAVPVRDADARAPAIGRDFIGGADGDAFIALDRGPGSE
jgi:hypothetical protein